MDRLTTRGDKKKKNCKKRKENVYRILSSVLPYLRIKKRRVELMLKYISLYPDTRGGVKQSEEERSAKIGLITEMYALKQGVVG